jgi:hypothetical protein
MPLVLFLDQVQVFSGLRRFGKGFTLVDQKSQVNSTVYPFSLSEFQIGYHQSFHQHRRFERFWEKQSIGPYVLSSCYFASRFYLKKP